MIYELQCQGYYGVQGIINRHKYSSEFPYEIGVCDTCLDKYQTDWAKDKAVQILGEIIVEE
jgi:hypothetical protein